MDNLKSLQQALSVDVRLEELMIMTADLLMDLIEQQGAPCQTIFNSSAVPNISLPDFIRRLHKFTQFSPECLLIAIIFIDRYNLALPDFTLSSLNVHKMVLTALLLATKLQDDFYYDNKAFQFAGGVNVSHLHQLELQMFQKLEYNLYVGEEQFEQLQLKVYQVYGDEDQN